MWFYDVSDDDGNEAVKGPFKSEEHALNAMDNERLNIARHPYRSLNRRAAEQALRSGGSRMDSDQPLPALPQF